MFDCDKCDNEIESIAFSFPKIRFDNAISCLINFASLHIRVSLSKNKAVGYVFPTFLTSYIIIIVLLAVTLDFFTKVNIIGIFIITANC